MYPCIQPLGGQQWYLQCLWSIFLQVKNIHLLLLQGKSLFLVNAFLELACFSKRYWNVLLVSNVKYLQILVCVAVSGWIWTIPHSWIYSVYVLRRGRKLLNKFSYDSCWQSLLNQSHIVLNFLNFMTVPNLLFSTWLEYWGIFKAMISVAWQSSKFNCLWNAFVVVLFLLLVLACIVHVNLYALDNQLHLILR